MSTKPPGDNELHELLQSWQVSAHDDPALASRVWARIATEKPRGVWAGWVEELSRLLAKPAAAFVAIAMFAAAGAIAARWQASHQHTAQMTRLAVEYAHSIDPILMTHASSAHREHVP